MRAALRNATKVSHQLSRRQRGQEKEVRAISWRAQHRLHSRYTLLLGRRLLRNKAMVAIAWELCGPVQNQLTSVSMRSDFI